MVGYFRKVTNKIFGRKRVVKREEKSEANILIYGQSDSGKKTVRDQICGQSQNADWKFEISDMDYFSMYGRGFERPIRKHNYAGVEALIFVIDSSDENGKWYAYYHLERLMNEEKLQKCSFAVIANKQDKPGSSSADEISKELEKQGITRPITWKVFPATAKTGDGLGEVFDWLTEQMGETEVATEELEDSKVVAEKMITRKTEKTDSIFLSNLVSKFKKTFFLSQIKA